MNTMSIDNEQVVFIDNGDAIDSGLRVLARMIARQYAFERTELHQTREPINANV